MRAELLDTSTVMLFMRQTDLAERRASFVCVIAGFERNCNRAGALEMHGADIFPDSLPGGESIRHHARIASGGGIGISDHTMVIERGSVRVGHRPLFEDRDVMAFQPRGTRDRKSDNAGSDDEKLCHRPAQPQNFSITRSQLPPIIAAVSALL